MSSQESPPVRRFPIEAGDSTSLPPAAENQEQAPTGNTQARPLRRCPGCHCLTLLHVPIDVYMAMGGRPRAGAT
ncbi:protein FAM229A [Pleurodeles waltl]|uniref:protein FAM229A n=1 Tax=Pleurodeles waltl TaxID=8319 RepID=UPI003709513C